MKVIQQIYIIGSHLRMIRKRHSGSNVKFIKEFLNIMLRASISLERKPATKTMTLNIPGHTYQMLVPVIKETVSLMALEPHLVFYGWFCGCKLIVRVHTNRDIDPLALDIMGVRKDSCSGHQLK